MVGSNHSPVPEIPGYKINTEIARGGMATVYRATQTSLQRQVALKVMANSLLEGTAAREQFFREGKLIASLIHPGILTVYDIGQSGSWYYLAAEYIEEGTLADRLNQRGTSIAQAIEITRQIADALGYAHDRGVVHRDIKPGNILFRMNGAAVLSDFGIAKLLGSTADVAPDGFTIGTPAYMSPEQLMARPQDGRSDLYSLGVVFYQLLVGQLPFPVANAGNGAGWKPPDRIVIPQLPRNLSGFQPIIDKLLASNPDDRYSSASQLINELDEVTGLLGTYAADRSIRGEHLSISKAYTSGNGGKGGRRWIPATLLVIILAGLMVWSPAFRGGLPGWLYYLFTAGLAVGLGYWGIRRAMRALALRKNHRQFPQDISQEPSDRTMILAATPSAQDFGNGDDSTGATGSSGQSYATVFLPVTSESASSQLPDVSLAITQCADPALVGTNKSLTHVPYLVGRAGQCDLSIQSDPGISREHMIIDYHSHVFTIRDAGSQNHTYVNGKQLSFDQAEPLFFGTQIRLGTGTVLTFVSGDLCELPDMSGQLLDGRYQLTERLHVSSKAAVYAAQDRKIPSLIAVKILSPQLTAYPGYMEQFRRDAEIAARLSHPHICKVLDQGETDVKWNEHETKKVHYLCMELKGGGNLADCIQDTLPIRLEQIGGWLRKLGEALDYAHREGVIHSGIKPSSVVFDQGQNPFLTDFALASTPGDETDRVIMGTPAFLAPEQWEGKPLTPAVDQYSLAVLVYLLVTGSRPYEGQENPDIRKQNFGRGPVPVDREAEHSGRRDVPAALTSVLMKAMATSPEDRYASVGEFAHAYDLAVSRGSVLKTGKARVFISYRREDSAGWANYFSKELENTHDIMSFVDTQRRDNAVRFPVRLEQAIEDCDIFICLLSDTTLRSAWVNEEIRLAYEHQKPMVPVFQEGFRGVEDGEEQNKAIEILLSYEGVHLLDRRNIHVEHTIDDLARIIKHTVIKTRGIKDVHKM